MPPSFRCHLANEIMRERAEIRHPHLGCTLPAGEKIGKGVFDWLVKNAAHWERESGLACDGDLHDLAREWVLVVQLYGKFDIGVKVRKLLSPFRGETLSARVASDRLLSVTYQVRS